MRLDIRAFIKSVIVAAGIAGTAVMAGPGSASAQALFLPATGADLRAAADAAPASNAVTKRSRIVRIDRNTLSRHIGSSAADLGNGVVRLNLFDDMIATFRRHRVTPHDDGGFVWEGIVPNQGVAEALLIVENGQVNGRVQLEDRLFTIAPVSGATHRITEVTPAAFPPEAPPAVPPADVAVPDKGSRGDIRAKTTIKILVAYTATAQTQAGGATAIVNAIKQAVALANAAYANGNIPITLKLVGTMKVSYNDSGTNVTGFSNDLNALTSGAPFATARNKRNTLQADLLSLFRRNDAAVCGLAWLPGTGIMPMPSASTAGLGFSVINHTCVTNLSFAHELAHNMGLNHDRYQDKIERGGAAVPNTFYNFGYSNLTKKQRTIMAYNTECAAKVAGGFCTRINWFSSPTIRATGGVVIGKSNADNTKRLRQTRTGVAAYR